MKNLMVLLMILMVSCKKDKPVENYLGVVNIEVSGKPEAIPHFEKGLLLLHSFEYNDSREAFRMASEIDPNMAMAYWGEAMTYNHSLWHEQDFEKGSAVVQNLNELKLDISTTELEKDFVKAVKILYESDSIKTNRDKNYAEFMQSLNENEVVSFISLFETNKVQRVERSSHGSMM